MRQLLDGRRIDDLAIKRIQFWAGEAVVMHPAGFWGAFSGGKDSVVIRELVRRAGVPVEWHCSCCGGVDAPEVLRFTLDKCTDVHLDAAPMSMWKLIRHKGLPPRRNCRFCCEVMKERGGGGRFVLTGTRAEESTRRSKRQAVESCYRDKTRRFLHPIFEWSTADVWQFIEEARLPYCRLYDEGFRRIGCV